MILRNKKNTFVQYFSPCFNEAEPLILNWDHTALKYVPVLCWTMAEQGAKIVSIAGIDDKCQISAVFTVTLDGQFLPVQLIYLGSTKACLPRVKFTY